MTRITRTVHTKRPLKIYYGLTGFTTGGGFNPDLSSEAQMRRVRRSVETKRAKRMVVTLAKKA